MPFPRNRPPAAGSYGPAGFGVQYTKKKTPNLSSKLTAATKKPPVPPSYKGLADKVTAPTTPAQAVRRPTRAAPYKGASQAASKVTRSAIPGNMISRRFGSENYKNRTPSIPSRPGPKDDVVGPNKPPSRSGDDTPDYSLTIKLGSIKRRMGIEPQPPKNSKPQSPTAKRLMEDMKKRRKSNYGGM